jgi:ketosteroid isomerase-like protein
MRKTIAVAVVCLLALSLGVAPAFAKSGGRAEDQIKKLEQDWAAAMVKDGPAEVDKYEADDIISTDPTGRVTDKTQDKKDLSSGDLKFQSEEVSDLTIHLYGNTAVAAGTATVKGTFKGQDISGTYRYTDVWVKRGGKWQVVASEATKVQ